MDEQTNTGSIDGRPISKMFSKNIVNNVNDRDQFSNLLPVHFDAVLKGLCREARLHIDDSKGLVLKYFASIRYPWVVSLPANPTSNDVMRWECQFKYIVRRITACTGFEAEAFVSTVRYNTLTDPIPEAIRYLIDPHISVLAAAMIEERNISMNRSPSGKSPKKTYPYGMSSV